MQQHAYQINQHAATASPTKTIHIGSCGYHCTTPLHFPGSSPGTALLTPLDYRSNYGKKKTEMVISCSQNRRTNEACFLQMHNVCSSCLLPLPCCTKVTQPSATSSLTPIYKAMVSTHAIQNKLVTGW